MSETTTDQQDAERALRADRYSIWDDRGDGYFLGDGYWAGIFDRKERMFAPFYRMKDADGKPTDHFTEDPGDLKVIFEDLLSGSTYPDALVWWNVEEKLGESETVTVNSLADRDEITIATEPEWTMVDGDAYLPGDRITVQFLVPTSPDFRLSLDYSHGRGYEFEASYLNGVTITHERPSSGS